MPVIDAARKATRLCRHPRLLRLLRLFPLPALLLSWQCLQAQPQPQPQVQPSISDADLERVRRSQPVITEQDIEQARRRAARQQGNSLDGIARPGGINIDALPVPAQGATAPGLDLEALGKGFDATTQTPGAGLGAASGPALMVFISLSMPEPTLRKLIDQAARAHATLIIRGLLDNSIRTTVTQVQALIGHNEVAFQIDPQAFDRFAVERVPSFVLVRDGARPASCASGVCAPPESFVKLSGDVSIDYALQTMQHRASGQSLDAAPFLRRLRAKTNQGR